MGERPAGFVPDGFVPDAAPAPKGVTVPGASFADKIRNAADRIKAGEQNLVIGAAKGVGSTVANLGEMAVNAGLVPGVTSAAFNSDFRSPIFQKTDALTTPTNTTQSVGKGLETAAEMAVPLVSGGMAAVDAIPSKARAGAAFQQVLSAAKNVPVDLSAPGDIALRIRQLADRGTTMPRPVQQFLMRATDPDKAAMTYEEAKDWASNISRLSANEYSRMAPTVAREVAGLRVALNQAVGQAASAAGKGAEYAQAMNEYAKAMRVRDVYDTFMQGVKRGLPYAGAAGAGSWLASRLSGLLPGE